MTVQSIKQTIFAATIVEPTGVLYKTETRIPETAHITEITAELIITDKKLLKSLIAERAGKIIRAEISNAPTRFMARTITTAVTTAIRMLYAFVFVPVAEAKFSSNVTAKIL